MPHKLILSWCEENQKALQEAWQYALEGKDIPWIQPLQ